MCYLKNSRAKKRGNKTYFCAKRSLRPWDSQNWVFRVFVRSFVRPFVRSFGIFGIFTKRIWGDHRCRWTLRFWNTGFKSFCKKRVEVLLSKQNEKYVDRFLDHFFGTFLKKVEIHIFHLSRFALLPCAVYLGLKYNIITTKYFQNLDLMTSYYCYHVLTCT